MGVCFLSTSLDGKKTPEQVQQAFRNMREEAEYSSGNEYSGDWNMCNGLSIRSDLVFENAQKAEAWLADNTQKWEVAKAVRFNDSKQEPVKEPTYGGKKASLTTGSLRPYDSICEGFKLFSIDYLGRGTDGTDLVVADQLTPAQKEKAKKLVEAYQKAHNIAEEARDNFLQMTEAMTNLGSDFSDFNGLKMARNKAILSKKADASTKAALIAYDKERMSKTYEEKTVSLGQQWMIGGWAAE